MNTNTPHMNDAESALTNRVNVLRLPQKGLTLKLAPDLEICAALAEEFEVADIENLEALLLVKRWHKDGVKVTGEISAKVTQRCVVTLNPVSQVIDTSFTAVYVPPSSRLAKPVLSGDDNELVIDPDGDDIPEIFDPPELDVGKIVSEFLALEIDPYPKAEGADEVAAQFAADAAPLAEEKAENPFAALWSLKDKM